MKKIYSLILTLFIILVSPKSICAEEISYNNNAFPYEKLHYFMESEYEDYTILIDYTTLNNNGRIFWGITVETDEATDYTQYFKYVESDESKISFTVKEILDNCSIVNPEFIYSIILQAENSAHINKIQVLSPEEIEKLNTTTDQFNSDIDNSAFESINNNESKLEESSIHESSTINNSFVENLEEDFSINANEDNEILVEKEGIPLVGNYFILPMIIILIVCILIITKKNKA